MAETDDIGQRVERLFGMCDLRKDLPYLSDDKIRELAKYSINELHGKNSQRARQILKAIGGPYLSYLSAAPGNNKSNPVSDIITHLDNIVADEAERPLEQNVESLFSGYNSPEDLSQLSDYKKRELSKYSIEELYGKDFSKAQEILEEIGVPALPSLFNALGNNDLNRVYDTIINIAKKHNAGDDVAKQVAGKLSHDYVRSKGPNLIMETGGSPLFLIYALNNKSDNGYAEEMLRGLHADERYTDIVNYELGKTLNPNHFYKDLVRERAKGILMTL